MVLAALLSAWGGAAQAQAQGADRAAIPPPRDGERTLVVHVQVTQPYIDHLATRVTYDGVDRVFGIEWEIERRGSVYITSSLRTEDGLWIQDGPCTKLDLTAPAADIGDALLEALSPKRI